jgi:biopolymer transport protein ExbD
MRLPTFQSSGGTAVSMTPMIDVVFQLIVFFTATSTIVKSEFSQTVDLPVAEKGKDRVEQASAKKITVNVDPRGFVNVAGRRVDATAFQELLTAELEQRSPDDIEVELRADRSAPYRAVEPILLVCARNGVWRVSFSVKRP